MTADGKGAGSLEERMAFFDGAKAFTPYLATGAGEALFLVKTEDQHIGRSLFGKQGRGELTTLGRAVAAIKGLVGPEAIEHRAFIDVGANIGTTTMPALLTHGFVSAVAIEPEPENVRVLRLNVLLNEMEDRVEVVPAAVSDELGHSNLVVDRSRGGKHWIYTDDGTRKPKAADPTILQVETVTLDHLAERGVIDPDATGLLWMDAEAHEGHILKGASGLLTRGTPIVLEWNPGNLDRQGDLQMILTAVREHYTHFVDMHRDPDPDKPSFPLQSIDSLEAHGERYLDPEISTNAKTDLLVVRLGSARGSAVEDVGAFVKAQPAAPVLDEAAPPPPLEPDQGRAQGVVTGAETPEPDAAPRKRRAKGAGGQAKKRAGKPGKREKRPRSERPKDKRPRGDGKAKRG